MTVTTISTMMMSQADDDESPSYDSVVQTADLIIFLAYYSIPVQILIALYKYPRVAKMPPSVYILLVLFAFFIFCCGTGHLLKCLHLQDSGIFYWTNLLTAVVSLVTTLYLIPLVPVALTRLDNSLVEELQKLNKETVESKNKLFTFMAFLCHEIRNPLFAITSSATNLQEDSVLSPEQEIAVGSIRDSADLMLRLVNDVLDLSKIDAGKLQLEPQTFSLHRLLHNLHHTIQNQVQNKHGDSVQFQIRRESDLPDTIRSDQTRLLQIIYNLLSNSIKFTDSGAIQLDVRVVADFERLQSEPTSERQPETNVTNKNQPRRSVSFLMASLNDAPEPQEADDGQEFSMALLDATEAGLLGAVNDDDEEDNSSVVWLRITVSDTGAGIHPGRLSTIFEPYSQAKLSDYRKHGGTGLGLSIISGLTAAMGGIIKASSELGKGSKFVVHLPVQVVNGGNATEIEHQKRASISTSSSSSSSDSNGDVNIPRVTGQPMKKIPSHVDLLSEEGETRISPSLEKSSSSSQNCFSFPPNESVVLVVDDNHINQKILSRMLTHFGLEHCIAGNGQEAVDTVMQNSRNVHPARHDLPLFQLIFMDLSMPVKDGYEAIAELRANHVHVPIVALTANALSREKVRATEAGATEFQTKPILRNSLLDVCQRYLLHEQLQTPSKK